MSLMDEFLRGFGDAVADIREKVINEPWYGRPLSGTPEHNPEPAAARPDLMVAFFEGRDLTQDAHGHAPEPSHTHDLGHDR